IRSEIRRRTWAARRAVGTTTRTGASGFDRFASPIRSSSSSSRTNGSGWARTCTDGSISGTFSGLVRARGGPNMATEKATFGAGCFWGVELTFRQIPGVVDAAVGYEGGHTERPTYKDVCTDTTG